MSKIQKKIFGGCGNRTGDCRDENPIPYPLDQVDLLTLFRKF